MVSTIIDLEITWSVIELSVNFLPFFEFPSPLLYYNSVRPLLFEIPVWTYIEAEVLIGSLKSTNFAHSLLWRDSLKLHSLHLFSSFPSRPFLFCITTWQTYQIDISKKLSDKNESIWGSVKEGGASGEITIFCRWWWISGEQYSQWQHEQCSEMAVAPRTMGGLRPIDAHWSILHIIFWKY